MVGVPSWYNYAGYGADRSSSTPTVLLGSSQMHQSKTPQWLQSVRETNINIIIIKEEVCYKIIRFKGSLEN